MGAAKPLTKALSRLVKVGQLRRVGHGLYDRPRFSNVLKRPAPVDLDAAVAALVRRDGIRIMPDGLVAANQLGLTNAVPREGQLCDGRSVKGRSRSMDERSGSGMQGRTSCSGRGKPSAPVVQALRWLGPAAAARQAGRFDVESPSPEPCEDRPL